jgi:hypothetical protein
LRHCYNIFADDGRDSENSDNETSDEWLYRKSTLAILMKEKLFGSLYDKTNGCWYCWVWNRSVWFPLCYVSRLNSVYAKCCGAPLLFSIVRSSIMWDYALSSAVWTVTLAARISGCIYNMASPTQIQTELVHIGHINIRSLHLHAADLGVDKTLHFYFYKFFIVWVIPGFHLFTERPKSPILLTTSSSKLSFSHFCANSGTCRVQGYFGTPPVDRV